MDDNRRAQILDTVAKLRVTNIRDGMDWVGLHYV
jgi:4-hydroxy-4-methyl-2-oxoglutarate aldolase